MSTITQNFTLGNIAAKIITITLSGTNLNLNLLSLYNSIYGASASAVRIICINNGTFGSNTDGNYAFAFGQFPNGSRITFINNGSILGAGGPATTGTGIQGGPALFSGYSNQTMTLRNNGQIYAGGGSGGIGGTGGQGVFYTFSSSPVGPSSQGVGDCQADCIRTYGSTAFCQSGCNFTPGYDVPPQGDTAGYYVPATSSCSSCHVSTTTPNYTNGGIGGTGGRGQGYDAGNNGGMFGVAGGTNAGSGGPGGVGGSWGSSGGTGSTGSNGNYTGGSAGNSGGSSGVAIQGISNITLINTGTILGIIA